MFSYVFKAFSPTKLHFTFLSFHERISSISTWLLCFSCFLPTFAQPSLSQPLKLDVVSDVLCSCQYS